MKREKKYMVREVIWRNLCWYWINGKGKWDKYMVYFSLNVLVFIDNRWSDILF